MARCYICNRKASKLSNLSFHRFPTDEESREKWLEIIGKSCPPPTKRSTICSLHFTEDCFRYGLVYGMRRLKEGSNPSLYLVESEEEKILLDQLHTTYVNQTLDDVVNDCKKENSDVESINSNEDLITFNTTKPKSPKSKSHKGKVNETKKENSNIHKRIIKFNHSWEKVKCSPDGGKTYWESAQHELIVRKKKIRTLQTTLRRTREKLLDVQTVIKELRENPYVAVYVQDPV